MSDETGKEKVFRTLYFSGTGNTEWVVKKIDEKLKEKEFENELLAADELWAESGRIYGERGDEEIIRKKLAEFIPEGATLIFAFPTYASDVPLPLKDLLELVPEGGDRKLAVISTLLLYGGDAVHVPERILKKKGYRTVLATYVKMPNNIKIPMFDMFQIINGEKLNSYYESGDKACGEIVEALVGDKSKFEGGGIADYVVGVSQRLGEKVLSDFVPEHLFATAACVRCALCADTCPMGNIDFSKGYPVFGKDCCLCLRCYNFCPVNAIQITDKTMNEEKYNRFKGFDGWKAPRLRKTARKGK